LCSRLPDGAARRKKFLFYWRSFAAPSFEESHEAPRLTEARLAAPAGGKARLVSMLMVAFGKTFAAVCGAAQAAQKIDDSFCFFARRKPSKRNSYGDGVIGRDTPLLCFQLE
jgi:hypothetical protein